MPGGCRELRNDVRGCVIAVSTDTLTVLVLCGWYQLSDVAVAMAVGALCAAKVGVKEAVLKVRLIIESLL